MNSQSLIKKSCALCVIVFLSACTVNKPIETSPPKAHKNSNQQKTNTVKPATIGIDIVEIKYEPLSAKGNTPYEVYGVPYKPLLNAQGFVERGEASWYGEPFHGQLTSNGELYDMHQLTAAHKTLPLPSYVKVTNLDNDASVIVRVNDRGPFIGERIIDLSYGAAKAIGMKSQGIGNVLVEAITPEVDENSKNAAAYYIQAGAFGSMGNAERLRDEIALQGYNATVKQEENLFKVKVGPYEDPQMAYYKAQDLSKQVTGHSYHVTH